MPLNINILLVDDQTLFRDGLVSLLNKHGIRTVAVAENGQQALSILKTKKPDVVLLDLEMPVLNGSKTFDNISKRFPTVKTVIISKYYDEQLIKDYFNRGARAYVSKNCKIEVVVSAIHTVHGGGVYKDNVPELLKVKAVKDKHYYKLLFSKRELEIIPLLIEGKTLPVMSTELFLAEKTLEKHLSHIYKKLKVKNRAEFLAYAIKEGLAYLGSPDRSKKDKKTKT